jgi:solute carrier family 35 (UDP-xylose/UDP-N-acetylglucosamine transporter), member B4
MHWNFVASSLAVSMLLGFFVLSRRYSVIQMLCVIVVSLGAILATLSKPSSPSSSSSSTSSPTADELQRYFLGISMVVASLLLTGILGVLQEQTYRKYGPCWQEGVFYTVSGVSSYFLLVSAFLFLFIILSSVFLVVTCHDLNSGYDCHSDASCTWQFSLPFHVPRLWHI